MKEVRIDVWCDHCFGDLEHKTVAETTPPLGVDGVYRTLDLCQRSDKALLAPLRELLADKGRKPTPEELNRPNRKPAQAKSVPATATRTTARAPASAAPPPVAVALAAVPDQPGYVHCPVCQLELQATSVITHLWGKHAESGRPAQPSRCPDCGFPEDGRTVPAQGMTAHRRTKHGYDPLAEALTAAGVNS